MAEEINLDRRRFVGTVAMTMAAAQVGMIGSAAAQTTQANPASGPTITSGTNTPFGSLKQIDAGLLKVATRKLALPRVLPLFFFTAGPTTFTAMSRSHPCWPLKATV